MSAESSITELLPPADDSHGQYVVVARRYRPQSFEELVGQHQVCQALRNAIATNRVGHAYLFTGARGVGKTSTARILAKCLNCVEGPTPEPCGRCDACLGIASGEDVDVLEIDGASNRGIDEIRQLRSNVNVRPSRSRFKIYIIDEVHMLTVPAFNALLKTLEEPPEHVEFIFCTTDPEKIPVTVLSRCQRFDFAPVDTDAILKRLRLIVQSEGVEADEAALVQLARRAAGSMRDSQSLLEQLLAFCGRRITEEDVHAMLGTARSGRLAAIADRLLARDAAGALGELDAAVREGVDVGQLAEQLLGYFRDIMAAGVGCDPDLMLHTAASDHGRLKQAAQQFGLETILAVVQILDHAVARMRQSTHVRTLLEMALVRISNLEDLAALPELIARLSEPAGAPSEASASRAPPVAGAPRAGPAQKKTVARAESATTSRPEPPGAPATPAPAEPAPRAESPRALTKDIIEHAWRTALAEVGGLAEGFASEYESLEFCAPDRVLVRLAAEYNKQWCQRPEVKGKIQDALARRLGQKMHVEFAVAESAAAAEARPQRPAPSRHERIRELQKHPLIEEAMRLFDADVTAFDEKRNA